jgi:glucose-1-phosphate adenylyltransferase
VTIPGDPDNVYASMGNYVFSTDMLIEALKADSSDEDSVHDMGGNIIPMMTKMGAAHVYDFAENDVPGATDRDRGYWRDVGTLDSYHDANMDLVSVHPIFNLYNRQWPILSHMQPWPPAKFVEGGEAHESIVGAGTIISGGLVDHSVVAFDVRVGHGAQITDSVLSSDVRIGHGAHVSDCVILPGAVVGRDAVVRRAILDKNVVIPDGAVIGVDPARDRELYTVSPSGIVVLGKNAVAAL